MKPSVARYGWTLKETLVVLGLLILIAVLVYPVYQIWRQRTLEARCRANLWAIYLKYTELKSNYRVGSPQFCRAFDEWSETAEAQKVLYCPLGQVPYILNRYTIRPAEHVLESPREVFLRIRVPIDHRELVAFCDCHRIPFTGECGGLLKADERFLAVFDRGGGQVRYADRREMTEVLEGRDFLNLIDSLSGGDDAP